MFRQFELLKFALIALDGEAAGGLLRCASPALEEQGRYEFARLNLRKHLA